MREIGLIVGLGNPGALYAGTRHNIGFTVVERLAERYGARFREARAKALVAVIRVGGAAVMLALPQTFMNLSGQAVGALLGELALSPAQMMLVYDDLDLPLGRIRLLPRGSSGGHKGVESVIAAVGTADFPRLRVGIGRPLSDGDVAAYVLSRFAPEEEELVQAVREVAVAALECVLREGLVQAMNKFNRRR
ncbi:aminoacyl-tRNA hydrolase [Thermodesulfitimonas sp.]